MSSDIVRCYVQDGLQRISNPVFAFEFVKTEKVECRQTLSGVMVKIICLRVFGLFDPNRIQRSEINSNKIGLDFNLKYMEINLLIPS